MVPFFECPVFESPLYKHGIFPCRFQMSEKYFSAALRQVKLISTGSVISEKWESLYNNLGHTCRKLGRLEEALAYHRQALVLKPQTASTYAAIGYVQTLQVKSFKLFEWLLPTLINANPVNFVFIWVPVTGIRW